MTRLVRCTVLALLALAPADLALAFPDGPAGLVADLAPTCAYCHASIQRDSLKGVPEGFVNSLLVEGRHYKRIEAGEGFYRELSQQDRDRLLQDVKAMDAAASVALSGPAAARPGQEITVTVTGKGGAGPVVGLFLVDTPLRFQARSPAGDGWLIVGPPKVFGPDGKEQTRWIDGRAPGLKKNLNSAVVYGVKSDLEKKEFPESKATWTLKAPQEPGTYTLTAAFHFGTEKASPAGRVERPGRVLPRGGFDGTSGRILFSQPVTVTVR